MLTMSGAADSCEAVAFHDALKSLTLGRSDNINEGGVRENISQRESVAEFEILSEVGLKLDQLAPRGGSCLFKVPLERLAGMFL